MKAAIDSAAMGSGAIDDKGGNATRAQIFAAGNFGKNRVSTGSHVDVKGGGVAVGLSEQFSKTLAGVFTEFGASDFDTYNLNNYHGDSDSKYYGAGVLVSYDFDSSRVCSARFGKNEVSWQSANGKYDDSVFYWGTHLGLGIDCQLMLML